MYNQNPMVDYQRKQIFAQQQMLQNQLNALNYNNQIQQQPVQFSPYPQNNQSGQPQFFVRQVGSIDEAKSFPVDPAVLYFFLNVGTGEIYFKKLNTENGKSELYIYRVQETEEKEKEKQISINDTNINMTINERLENIEKMIGGLLNNAKSVSNVESNAKSDRNNASTNYVKVQAAKSPNVQPNTANDGWEE